MSSVAPTLMTYGSFAGEVICAFGPALPTATTTTTPCSQASSTAASSMSVLYELTMLETIDRLMTRMLYVRRFLDTHSMAAMTSDTCAMPVLSLTLMLTMLEPGAIPMYLPLSSVDERPQPRPPMMPATNVPWPLSSWPE